MVFRIGPSEGEKKLTVYEHQSWPAWFYHPKTGEGKIFQSAAEVPEDWVDSPGGTRTVKEHGFEEGTPRPVVGNSDYSYQAWPAWFYDPDTGNGDIFNSRDEVPEGWQDSPVLAPKRDANSLEASETEDVPLEVELPDSEDRAGIAAALKERNIRFNSNWKTQRMYDTLVDALKPKE